MLKTFLGSNMQIYIFFQIDKQLRHTALSSLFTILCHVKHYFSHFRRSFDGSKKQGDTI